MLILPSILPLEAAVYQGGWAPDLPQTAQTTGAPSSSSAEVAAAEALANEDAACLHTSNARNSVLSDILQGYDKVRPLIILKYECHFQSNFLPIQAAFRRKILAFCVAISICACKFALFGIHLFKFKAACLFIKNLPSLSPTSLQTVVPSNESVVTEVSRQYARVCKFYSRPRLHANLLRRNMPLSGRDHSTGRLNAIFKAVNLPHSGSFVHL